MRLFLITSLTMVAFAVNSILNRMALFDDAIGPAGFALIRVATGALVLFALMSIRGRSIPKPVKPQIFAVAGLTAYVLGFSFAYVSMDAGIGALVLFGGVQTTMFVGALIEGEAPPARRWIGMALAMVGLVVLSIPTKAITLAPAALILMTIAAVGWGVYSLIGRRATNPISATGWNFIYCLPVVLIAWAVWPDTVEASTRGMFLAMLSGGITSALGYALWYSILPTLGATKGALAQLSVPAIALALGAIFLQETITPAAVLAAALILGGIAVAVMSPKGKT